MKIKLQFVFGFVLLCMLIVTSWASGIENVFVGGGKLLAEPWGIATLFDTYFAFFTFYAWVFYKETSWFLRLAWLVAIIVLGNIAMASYVLWQLRKLKRDFSASDLLLRKSS
jgi:hypothetical protein